jgi:hypothetical protein
VSVSVTAPSGGVSVWVDVDSSTEEASQLSGEIRNGSGWNDITFSETVFGLGSVVTIQPGTVEVRLSSTADATPDVALTVVDASGSVLSEARSRLAVPGAPVTPGDPDPSDDPSDTPSNGPSNVPSTSPAPNSSSTPGLNPAANGGTGGAGTGSGTSGTSGTRDGALSSTGVSIAGGLTAAVVLLLIGFVVLTVRRRRLGENS